MKNVLLLLFVPLSLAVWGQRIQTILPAQPVVLGTAFQVQYVITDPAEITNINTPDFDSFRLVSGPNYYKGNAMTDGRMQPIENITYTLVPLREGNLRVGGITASFKTSEEKSKDGIVVVVPPAKASFSARSSYTDISLYAPSSKKDLQKLVDQNLFIKAEVSKKSCFEGEPVVVTFKLYSRLQSSSEAVKSPAFYGFSVIDLVNLDEAHAAVETIDGKVFNTSVLRQVQLYPVQSGTLTIDPMYVQNEIEFNDSVQNKKITIAKELVTKPVTILVNPLPDKRPDNFTGAVGRFAMDARLEQAQTALKGQN
ncbi:MAG TPA: BatD family protein, partial [Flavisolibacter sp.]|nr:BatD family protein [Flavisolibacter sp.]